MVAPRGTLPQAAWKLDNDFGRLFEGEALLAVDTLNLDAASFAQIEEAARGELAVGGEAPGHDELDRAITYIVLRTIEERGKQHNHVTGSGGMLLGRVLQRAPGRPPDAIAEGDRVATLVSLTLTPLRIEHATAVRRSSGQIDVVGEAVVFASGACVRLPGDLSERLSLAVLDVAGAAAQIARRVRPGHVVVVLGAGGKSGILCVAEARRAGGRDARIVGVESHPRAAEDLRALGLCDAVVVADARDALAARAVVLESTGGREADVTVSCVNVPDAEMAAVLVTRDRGSIYFFAMSTSFTKAALGAEGVAKDVDLFIGNGYAQGHVEHTLALLRSMPELQALFERRYGAG